MKVNGKIVLLSESVSLASFLSDNKYQINRIAVEKNGSIVPQKNYEITWLDTEDVLEIVRFVGGG